MMAYLLMGADAVSILAVSASQFTIESGGTAIAGSTRYIAAPGAVTLDGGSGANFLLTDPQPHEYVLTEGAPVLSVSGAASRKAKAAAENAVIAATIGVAAFQSMIRRRAAVLNDGTAAGGLAAINLLKEFNL